MWIFVLTVIIGLLIIFSAIKIQNTETLSTSISENDSFVDNVLYTFEITEVESFQENLQKIVDSETHEKLVEVTARIISEPSNKLDKHAIKVEVKGMAVGYLYRNDEHQLKGNLIDHKVAAAINVDGDSFYNVKLALQNVLDLKEI